MDNFSLKEERTITEINGKGKLFVHKRTGARVFCIEVDDDNNLFSITFKTPAYDDKGTSHILEHSVLGGSKNFPIKDPFRELSSSSLKTLLSAMTGPDKTMYPIASKNETDFFNLMTVYLDAVFYPKIYEREETFKQEGWHYYLENPKSDLIYNGVVYNEMRGFLSSPENLLEQRIRESLYPNTQYAKEFGGKPQEITKLSYKECLKYHTKYYHPSNSYIFFYGNGDMGKRLDLLDKEYLRHFKKKSLKPRIKRQKAFPSSVEKTFYYAISKEEKTNNKTYLSMNFSLGESTNLEKSLACQILSHALLGVEGAPLKEALLKSNLGSSVSGFYEDDILQTYMTIVLKNADAEGEKEFERLIIETLKEIVRKGIDRDLIEGAINRIEFVLREGDVRNHLRGLFCNFAALKSWLYNDDPFVHLVFESALKNIKKNIEKGYFENLIQTLLLDNQHRSLVVLKPSKTVAMEQELEIRRELEDYKLKIGTEGAMDILRDTIKLKNFQNTPDKQEDIDKIPKLSLNEIETTIQKIPKIIDEINETKILSHPTSTNNIVYLEFIFDTKHIPLEQVQILNFLTLLFGKLNTKNNDYIQLNHLVNKNTGGLYFLNEVFPLITKKEGYRPKFTVKVKCLEKDVLKALNLVGEILFGTDFVQKARIKEILREKKSEMESNMISAGHLLALSRLYSYFSDIGRYQEYSAGLSFYEFLKSIDTNFDEQWNTLSPNLLSLSKNLFWRNNLFVNITCDKNNLDSIKNKVIKFLSKFDSKSLRDKKYNIHSTNINEGLAMQTDVQYVAKGYNFKSLGYKYTGIFKVLDNLIASKYFWNNIRLRGGAYGAMSKITKDGKLLFVSYRDPHIRRTLSVYDGLAESLEKFDVSTQEMEKLIIGAISDVDKPLSPSMKGEISTRNYIIGITDEMLQREREEVLETKSSDIKEFAEMIRKAMGKDNYCVVGSRTKLDENKDLFDKILDVFK